MLIDPVLDAHCFGIADFEEIDRLGLKLDHLAFGKARSPDANWVALVQAKLIHDLWRRKSARVTLRPASTYPLWQIDGSFLSNEFEHADMCIQIGNGRIRNFKVDRQVNVELGWSRPRESDTCEYRRPKQH